MLNRLHETVAAVCPIHGVSGVQGDITISFNGATAPQQTAANSAVSSFDWSQAAHDIWLAARTGNPVLRHAMVRLSANRQTTSNALSDVAGLEFQLKPNTHYSFAFVGAYTAVGATTGISLAVNGPASPSLVRVVGCIAESATTTRNGATGAYNTAIAGLASGGATAMTFWIDGNISTGAAGGTFILRFASETNGNAVTILSGSMGELKEIGA